MDLDALIFALTIVSTVLQYLLWIAAILLIYTLVMHRFFARKPEQANPSESEQLEDNLATLRTKVAVFGALSAEVDSLRQTKEIYERELPRLDQAYEQAVKRNALVEQLYGAFDDAWKGNRNE